MHFEYDPAKSEANTAKPGIDFKQAKALWQEEDRIEIPARSDTEPRKAIIARHLGKIRVGYFTMRGDSCRITSVRRARTNEQLPYYGEVDILPYLDIAKAVRPGRLAKRVNADFPAGMVAKLDFEADRLGIPRQFARDRPTADP